MILASTSPASLRFFVYPVPMGSEEPELLFPEPDITEIHKFVYKTGRRDHI
jgi:hypothetical protein